MSVDAITSSLGNATISDPTTVAAGGDKIKSAKDEAVLLSAAEGRRLYIGNLAYATTEEGLKEFFKGFPM
jgi:RNA recognition motif-containing protein